MQSMSMADDFYLNDLEQEQIKSLLDDDLEKNDEQVGSVSQNKNVLINYSSSNLAEFSVVESRTFIYIILSIKLTFLTLSNILTYFFFADAPGQESNGTTKDCYYTIDTLASKDFIVTETGELAANTSAEVQNNDIAIPISESNLQDPRTSQTNDELDHEETIDQGFFYNNYHFIA